MSSKKGAGPLPPSKKHPFFQDVFQKGRRPSRSHVCLKLNGKHIVDFFAYLLVGFVEIWTKKLLHANCDFWLQTKETRFFLLFREFGPKLHGENNDFWLLCVPPKMRPAVFSPKLTPSLCGILLLPAILFPSVVGKNVKTAEFLRGFRVLKKTGINQADFDDAKLFEI